MGDFGVFITGFPGFIASQLLRRLIPTYGEGTRYYFLVQSRFLEQARGICEEFELLHPEFDGSWILAEGDLRAPDLGLDPVTVERVRSDVRHVWHLAAIYDLAVPLSRAYAVNVDGTRNLLDFCETMSGLERLLYVSTCYVSGDRTGRVLESELDKGQDFKNHYEATKFWAECEVQRRWDRIPTVIFRPAIVVGDSRTGETVKGDGPYYLIQLLLRLPRWVPMVYIGASDARINLVPVDFVVDAMAAIAQREDAAGHVFQLADPEPMAARELIDLVLKRMRRAPAWLTVPRPLFDGLLEVPGVRWFLEIPDEAFDYFNHRVEYDCSNTLRFLEGTGISCPHVSTYVDKLIAYAREHPEIFAPRPR